MTANAIVRKLDLFLAEPVDSECKVVYVLCEVRKLLEPVPAHQRPFALNMYCHWALHVDLHGKGTITPFLQQVDAYVHGVLVGPEDFGASDRMVREFLFFDTFRSQLRDFFQTKGIRADLTERDDRWNEFVTHYAGVIEDGSLSILATDHGLTHVKEVTFLKGRDAIGEICADTVRHDLVCIAARWPHLGHRRERPTAHEWRRSDDQLRRPSALGRCEAGVHAPTPAVFWKSLSRVERSRLGPGTGPNAGSAD